MGCSHSNTKDDLKKDSKAAAGGKEGDNKGSSII